MGSIGRRLGKLACRLSAIPAAFAAASSFGPAAHAYTSAGDRSFPASILLPQIAPSDELYFLSTTQSFHSATEPSDSDRLTNFSGVFDKTITERLGVTIEDGYNRLSPAGGPTATGWQNLELTVKYLAILDPASEFLFTIGADREFGGTGAQRIGANPRGATTPTVYFGKGLGDIGIDALRPLAVKGTFGYQITDGGQRSSQIQAGLAFEYSIPYLESKVRALGLPDLVANATPMVEFFMTTPTRSSPGSNTTLIVAPGVAYSGEGWELAVEALVPTTRTTGSGIGAAVQLHFALDFLFPGSIGRPIFSP
jgi:hypothetical protein